MIRSIRLRLIDWLERILDKMAELRVKHLRKLHIEPKPRADMSLGRAIPVNDTLGQRYVDYASANNAALCEQRRHDGRNIFVNDDPIHVAYLQGLTRPNHDFLSHQSSPFGKNHLDSLNAKSAGVEGRGR